MLGGEGKDTITPETFCNMGTGMVHPASGSSEAREMPESTKPSSPRLFKKQDLLCRINEGGGPMTSKRSSTSSSASLLNPT